MVQVRIARIMVMAAFATALATAAASQPAGRGGGGRGGGAEQITSIEERTKDLKKIDGFFPMYLDEPGGKLWLEIPKLDTEVLYSTGLATGLGSNDIGLDRGMGTGAKLVSFQRVGPRVLLVQPNMSFRSSSPNVLERKSVQDSFATSVLWGFAVAAESNGHVLIDATDFLLRDVTGAAGALRVGLAPYTDDGDVDRLLDGLAAFLVGIRPHDEGDLPVSIG